MTEPTVGDHAPNISADDAGSVKRTDDEFAESSRVEPSAEEPFAGSKAEADELVRSEAASQRVDVGGLTGKADSAEESAGSVGN